MTPEPTTAEERTHYITARAQHDPTKPRYTEGTFIRRLIADVDRLTAEQAVDRGELQAYMELLDDITKMVGGENYVDAARLVMLSKKERDQAQADLKAEEERNMIHRQAMLKAQAELRAVREIVDAQAEDEGLWFLAVTAPEAYLQQELRRLHAAVEGDRALTRQERTTLRWHESNAVPLSELGEEET